MPTPSPTPRALAPAHVEPLHAEPAGDALGDASEGASTASARPLGPGLSAHILPTSATMIGVCMTVLTIGQIGPAGRMRWVTDKLLAVDALMFLCSALLSFISMRSRRGRALLEVRAEWVFIAALALLACAAVVLAFSIK